MMLTQKAAPAAVPPPKPEPSLLLSRISGYLVSKGEPGEVSNALQRSWRFMWDDAEPTLRLRVAGALLCMVGAKLMSIQVPFLFKAAVDLLGVDAADGGSGSLVAAALTPTALMLLYGTVRASADGLTQLRNALFVQVTEGALRRMARRTFRHLHSMDLRFHLNRQTGALSRVIERGTRAVGTLLSTTVLQAAVHAAAMAAHWSQPPSPARQRFGTPRSDWVGTRCAAAGAAPRLRSNGRLGPARAPLRPRLRRRHDRHARHVRDVHVRRRADAHSN